MAIWMCPNCQTKVKASSCPPGEHCARGIGWIHVTNDESQFRKCLAIGTKIATPTGYHRIETIKKGHIVYGFDPVLKLMHQAEVVRAFCYPRVRLWQLQHELGSVKCTAFHTFHSEVGWKALRSLRVGDFLTKVDEQSGDLQSSQILSIRKLNEHDDVFNLRVAGGNGSFIAAGIVAHSFTGLRWFRQWMINNTHAPRRPEWSPLPEASI